MAYDRQECEQAAATGAGEATYWLLGGPTSLIGQQMTRQRHAAFSVCMEARGYRTAEP